MILMKVKLLVEGRNVLLMERMVELKKRRVWAVMQLNYGKNARRHTRGLEVLSGASLGWEESVEQQVPTYRTTSNSGLQKLQSCK